MVWLFFDNLPGNRRTPRRNINTTAKIDGSGDGEDGEEFAHLHFLWRFFKPYEFITGFRQKSRGEIF